MRGYASAASSTSASYLYDPFARRVKKSVNGTATWFLWDGDRLLAEFDASGDRARRYTYASGYPPAEQVVVAGASEAVQQVHADHLDTPRALSRGSGDAIWRAAYHAFGSSAPDEDPDGDLTNTSFAIRFPGQFADAEGSFHYNRHRYLAPTLGRYMALDPAGQWGILLSVGVSQAASAKGLGGSERAMDPGPNGFLYAGQSPISLMDPLGLGSVLNDSGTDIWVADEYTKRPVRIPPRGRYEEADGFWNPNDGSCCPFADAGPGDAYRKTGNWTDVTIEDSPTGGLSWRFDGGGDVLGESTGILIGILPGPSVPGWKTDVWASENGYLRPGIPRNQCN